MTEISYISDDIISYSGKKLYRSTGGRDRDVFFYNDICIKVNMNGSNDCKREYQLWMKRFKNCKYSKYFVPILEYGEILDFSNYKLGYVIMPKINFLSGNREKDDIEMIDFLIKRYDLKDIYPADYAVNWGVDSLTQQPVIYDYAG